MFKCVEIIDRCNELSIRLLFISLSLLSSRRMGEEQEQILPLGGHGLEDGRGSSLALLSKGSASPEAVITGIPQRACRESARGQESWMEHRPLGLPQEKTNLFCLDQHARSERLLFIPGTLPDCRVGSSGGNRLIPPNSRDWHNQPSNNLLQRHNHLRV